MANPKIVPEELHKMLKNTPNYLLKWSTLLRCRQAYLNITYNGWPTEKTVAAFGLSTTWYHKLTIRNQNSWDLEHQAEEEVDAKQKRDMDRVLFLLGIKSDDEKLIEDAWDTFQDVLYTSPIGKKVVVDDNEGSCSYDHISDPEIISLKKDFLLKWNSDHS